MDFIQIRHQIFKVFSDSALNLYPNLSDEISKWTLEGSLFIPESRDHGFLSTNIAMQIQGLLKKSGQPANPQAIAKSLIESISSSIQSSELKDLISKVEVAGPGFINFYASDKLFSECTSIALNTPVSWGTNSSFQDKSILIEFTDPNPFKEFHIGHLMSNCIGESLARLYEFSGATVHRLCYQGDVGMHVAKTIWAWNIDTNKKDLTELSKLPLPDRVKLLGTWYSIGSKAYTDGTDQQKEEIKQINKSIFSREDDSINELYDQGRKWSLEAFDEIYARLGTKFEKFYFESSAAKTGVEIVSKYTSTLFEKSNGAIIFPGEKYGLHSRVFINSQGLPTYEAKELGLATTKDKDFKYDASIIVTGNEINDYFKVLIKAMELISPTIHKKTKHIGHGMLRLPEGKMSSRTGNVITGTGLLKLVADKIKEVNPTGTEQLTETLAISALKFSLLKQNIGSDVIFNISDSVSLNGATGVYIQYSHARACSLLEKSGKTKLDKLPAELQITDNSKKLYRELIYFPHIVSQACTSHSPNMVSSYLLNIAQLFNSFYAENRIIDSKDEQAGLILTQIVRFTLANGMRAIGISPVDKM